MYSSSYSRAKFGLESREPLHKPKGKSCGYYMRIIFFFSSLIQSLIIVSLVLFLIYGRPEKSAEEKRVKELELNFNRLSENNIQLRKEKGELGDQLGARTAEKAALEKEMENLKTAANNTEHELLKKVGDLERQVAVTRTMVVRCPTQTMPAPPMLTSGSEMKTLQTLNAQQRAFINLIEANFTQTVRYLSQERDNALKDRDSHHQDAIAQRRENTMLKEQLVSYTRKCKEDFAHSLDGIKTVTSEFLNKINNLFPHQLTFHLTCDSQQEQMEKIRTSCTNLSRDVENKFQLYLDTVGNKVSQIQVQSSRLEVQNSHLTADFQKCQQSRSEAISDASKQLELKQRNHDDQVERLLTEQNRFREQKKLLEDTLALKESEFKTLLLSAQQNCKPVGLKPVGPQLVPPFNRQTVPNWPAPGIGKTPTGR